MIFRTTLLLLMIASLAHGEIYRWVDEQGNVHFSDSRPATSDVETVDVQAPPIPAEPDEGELRRLELIEHAEADRRARNAERTAQGAEQANSRQTATDRAERCYQTRSQYFWLEREAPVYRDEAGQYRSIWRNETYQGDRVYLTEAQRAIAQHEIHLQLVDDCDQPFDSNEMDRAQERWFAAELCAAERVRLESLQQPNARASRDSIDNQRAKVEQSCH